MSYVIYMSIFKNDLKIITFLITYKGEFETLKK